VRARQRENPGPGKLKIGARETRNDATLPARFVIRRARAADAAAIAEVYIAAWRGAAPRGCFDSRRRGAVDALGLTAVAARVRSFG